MIKIDHPWQVGPTELIEFALDHMHKGSDFDRRLAFLILDVGVETLFKTFLTLPDSVMQFQIKRNERLEASQGNFHELLRGIQNSSPKKNDPVVDSVEVDTSFGRYRIERLKSQAIRVLSLDTNVFETPVKPFLRAVIEEKSLPIGFTLESGAEKNTRALGKDVIDALKPSAWHGWVAGQKIQRDKLIAELTGRIREGKADEKQWETVDYIRSLKDEILVFQPVGKGWGNSPFNLNCWYTTSGHPIKKP